MANPRRIQYVYYIIDSGGGWRLLYGTATVGFVVAELFSTFANPMHILEHPIWLIYLICTVAIVVCRRFTQRYLWLYVDGYWLCLLDCDYGLKLHQIRPGINKGASSVGSGAIIRQCYHRAPVKWAISKQIQTEITVTRSYTFRLTTQERIHRRALYWHIEEQGERSEISYLNNNHITPTMCPMLSGQPKSNPSNIQNGHQNSEYTNRL